MFTRLFDNFPGIALAGAALWVLYQFNGQHRFCASHLPDLPTPGGHLRSSPVRRRSPSAAAWGSHSPSSKTHQGPRSRRRPGDSPRRCRPACPVRVRWRSQPYQAPLRSAAPRPRSWPAGSGLAPHRCVQWRRRLRSAQFPTGFHRPPRRCCAAHTVHVGHAEKDGRLVRVPVEALFPVQVQKRSAKYSPDYRVSL